MKIKKRKKKKVFTWIILLIVLVIVLSYFFLKYYSNKAYPIIKNYSESEVKKITLLIINKSIAEQINDTNTDVLFNITYNKSGEILLIDFDTKSTTEILNNITSLIEKNMKALEEGKIDSFNLPKNSLDDYDTSLLSKKIICEIPFGIVTKSSLLSNLGPKIPIKLSLIDNVITGFTTEVTEYGINNAMLKLLIKVKVNTRIILPITTENYTVETELPLAVKIVQGKIPNYYLNGFTTNSNITK